MALSSTQIWVLAVTVMTALGCTLIGNFLVLRKASLIGDAVSHSVLPGIVIAFLISGSLNSTWFFILAVLTAILMAVMIQYFSNHIEVSKESIIGIVFTGLFALGVVLLVKYAGNVHLDQDAVLLGQVEFSAFERLRIFSFDVGPINFWKMFFVFVLNSVLITIFWKEFKLSTFDESLALGFGFRPNLLNHLIMALTAITVVMAFEAVGAILVVALLIVPSLIAYVLSKRLIVMMFLSLIFAFLSGFSGYFFALLIDGSIAGAVSVSGGIFLIAAVLLKRFLLESVHERQ